MQPWEPMQPIETANIEAPEQPWEPMQPMKTANIEIQSNMEANATMDQRKYGSQCNHGKRGFLFTECSVTVNLFSPICSDCSDCSVNASHGSFDMPII